MKHAIIVGHPSSDSLNLAIAAAYARAAQALGHEAIVRDLYRIPFDPLLKADERPDRHPRPVHADVADERELLKTADVIALVYPLWFGTPPAIVKGYIERVFGSGFAFGSLRLGRTDPLLTAKQLISFSTSSSPEAWFGEQGTMESLRTLFDTSIARVTGMTVVDHVHFGSIVPELDARKAAEHLATVEAVVRTRFVGGSGVAA